MLVPRRYIWMRYSGEPGDPSNDDLYKYGNLYNVEGRPVIARDNELLPQTACRWAYLR